MKKFLQVFILISFLTLITVSLFAQVPPHPNGGGGPGGGNIPVGGGAPLDGGLTILFISGLIYSIRKKWMKP